MPRRRAAAALILVLFAGGCDVLSREARIEHRLEKAGLKPKLARCMAHKLDEKLTTDELDELAHAIKRPREQDGPVTLAELSDRLNAMGDPHVIDVISRAGLGCAILG